MCVMSYIVVEFVPILRYYLSQRKICFKRFEMNDALYDDLVHKILDQFEHQYRLCSLVESRKHVKSECVQPYFRITNFGPKHTCVVHLVCKKWYFHYRTKALKYMLDIKTLPLVPKQGRIYITHQPKQGKRND